MNQLRGKNCIYPPFFSVVQFFSPCSMCMEFSHLVRWRDPICIKSFYVPELFSKDFGVALFGRRSKNRPPHLSPFKLQERIHSLFLLLFIVLWYPFLIEGFLWKDEGGEGLKLLNLEKGVSLLLLVYLFIFTSDR